MELLKKVKIYTKKSLPFLFVTYQQLRYRLNLIKDKSKFHYTFSDFKKLVNLNNPFFIVLIPGSIHIFEIFLKFIPPSINIVLVLNGLDQWEQSYVRSRFIYPSIFIREMTKHGKILDLIFDNFKKPFGIIDYDCFVIDISLFERIINIPNPSLMNAVFLYHDDLLNLDIPRTFFLFLNTPLINKIRKRYHLTADTCVFHELPRKAKKQISKLGINDQIKLMNNLSNLDTLHAILSIGFSVGLNVNFIERLDHETVNFDKVVHIGGISKPNEIHSMYSLRGAFFWRKSLEAHPSNELRLHYYKLFGEKTSEELIQEHPERFKRISKEFLNTVNYLIKY